MASVAPPGWPDGVLPPGVPDWERTAANWLLDQCPPDFRGYPALRRHLIVLAWFAVKYLDGSRVAIDSALSEARGVLGELADPETVDAAVETLLRESARLVRVRREAGLVEEAVRGRRFVARLL